MAMVAAEKEAGVKGVATEAVKAEVAKGAVAEVVRAVVVKVEARVGEVMEVDLVGSMGVQVEMVGARAEAVRAEEMVEVVRVAAKGEVVMVVVAMVAERAKAETKCSAAERWPEQAGPSG